MKYEVHVTTDELGSTLRDESGRAIGHTALATDDLAEARKLVAHGQRMHSDYNACVVRTADGWWLDREMGHGPLIWRDPAGVDWVYAE